MKILNLKFKNLNSLYGSWSIDFQNEAYINDGIFAITGPTGSGKSTILDAICLALYGGTPRLSRISSSNDIMSRGEGECFSEVTFTTDKGSYRVFWYQHRARKSPDGNLMDSRHEISNAITGEILGEKKTQVKEIIEDVTGMDLERFTRSTLLAQGSFAAFLQASSDDKSKILQQITGTDIYTKISLEVHRRRGEQELIVNSLKGQIDDFSLLDDDEEANLRDRYENDFQREKDLQNSFNSISKLIDDSHAIQNLEKELKEFRSEKVELDKKLGDSQLERELLKKSNMAYELWGEYLVLKDSEDREKRYRLQLDSLLKRKPISLKEKESFLDSRKASEELLSISREKLNKELKIINRVRVLDLEIREKDILLEKLKEERVKILKNKDALFKREEESNKKLDKINKTTASYVTSYKGSKPLGELVDNIGEFHRGSIEISRTLENIWALEKSLDKDSLELSSLEIKKGDEEDIIQELQQEMLAHNKRENEILNNRTIRELELEKEFLLKESAYIEQIDQLIEGSPCPLCGSINHPKVSKKEESIDSISKKLRQINMDLKELEKINRDLSSIKERVDYNKIRVNQSKKDIEKSKKSILENKGKLDNLGFILNTSLENLGELLGLELTRGGVIWTLEELNKVLTSYSRDLSEIKILEASLFEISKSQKELEISSLEIKKDIEKLTLDLEDVRSSRFELYRDKNPREEEDRLRTSVKEGETELSRIGEILTRKEKELLEIDTKIDSLNSELEDLNRTLKKSREDRGKRLNESPFSTYEEVEAAIISQDEILTLERKFKDLDDRDIEIKTYIHDREEKLKGLQQPVESLKVLEESLKESEAALKSLRMELGSIDEKLKQNESSRKELGKKLEGLNREKMELEKWNRLHGLIGSSDGKKFRNFAQGLTFEVMVSHANRQLALMSDRYLLIRDYENPLELNVVDNYLGGEIRPCKNLSGGESFIVSLSLALGLSSLASNRVKIDSLFLDEGFGTLDDDSLSVALDTLSALHQRGKSIGVISHVNALKERIPTQIEIVPKPGGRSSIKGPGCSNS